MGRLLPASLAVGLLLIFIPMTQSLAASKRALLIGVNEYRANDPDLKAAASGTWIPEDLQGAINDISLMEQVLITRFGFEKADIQRLENEQATRAAILEALTTFVSSTEEDDIVYIHFSGHGSQVEDQDGDEEDGKDETILSYDARTPNIPDITDDELNRIFAGLSSPNSLIVLDSCHSGTATRGSSAMRARSVPADSRGDLYSGLGTRGEQPVAAANYLLMTGAAAYQSALDGPLDDGRYYGLFSLSLGRSLGRVPTGASATELHGAAREEMERIGAEFGLFAVPEAQLEGNPARMNLGVLGESRSLARRNATRLAWAPAQAEEGVNYRLLGAEKLAARAGSVWAVYPQGEQQFAPGQALGLVTVRKLEGGDALAQAEPGMVSVSGGRAIQMLDAPPGDHVAVRLDRMTESQREDWAAALQATPGGQSIELVGPGEFARFIVDRETGHYAVFGAGGLQRISEIPAYDIGNAAARLVTLSRRSLSVNELMSLDNAASRMRVSARVNPVDAAGKVRGISVVGAASAPAYRVRRPDETRDLSNSLILEVETSRDAYLTIVNIDPDGSVDTLFPNAISERNGFYPDGRIPGGQAVRIPDGLEGNQAGFNWDFVPPLGIDTLRVFAASDLETAAKIRAHVGQIGRSLAQRGGSGRDSRTDLLAVTPRLQNRGIQTAASESAAYSDWTATTVTLVIEE